MSSPTSQPKKLPSKEPYFATLRPLPLPGPDASHKQIADYLRRLADQNFGPKVMLYQVLWDLADSLDP